MPRVLEGVSFPLLPLLMASFLGAGAGCAAERERPDAGGVPCEDHEECNALADGGVRVCGSLALCVAGHCEVALDAGAPGARILPCR